MIKPLGLREGLIIVATMWIVFIIDIIIPGFSFNQFGIRPRSITGLTGIIFSPFLHANLYHIISNTIPILVLPILIGLSIKKKHIVTVMVLGVIGSGIGTWIFSTGGVVVGASGLVFALIGFLFANAYFSPSIRSWLSAVISFFLYGGALLSLFSFLPYISWAAHFWGFISGIIIAAMLRKSR